MIVKQITLLLSALIAIHYSYSQETKQVTKRRSMSSEEVYYVTKKDKIKEGPYQLFRTGAPLITGYYADGKKDSTWIYYSYRSILSKQYYRKGDKIGTWRFYKNDTLEWTYDFDSSKVHFFIPPDSIDLQLYPAFQDEKGNWVYHIPEQHALMISTDYFYKLQENLQYPESAQNTNQQGQSNIAVLIDEYGKPVSYEVGISSGHPALDAEALRVIRITEPEFIPAKNNGVNVKSLVLFKVNFRLESK
jgi:TonB family protein